VAKSTDITDIERESIEFSRRHYEAITVGLVIQNKKSAIIYANNVASEILDVPKDELIGRTSADSRWQAIKEDGTPFPLEDYPAMVTLRTGKPVKNVVMGISTSDGKQRWILVSSEPVIDPSTGKMQEVMSTFVDITEQKWLVEELSQRTCELEAIFHGFPDIYFWVDAEGIILDYHVARAEDLFIPPEEFLGRKMPDILPKDAARKIRDGISRVSATKELVSTTYSLPMLDGERIYETRLAPLPDGHILMIIRDITVPERAQEALKEAEEKYRSLVEESLIGVYIIQNRSFIYVNPRFTEIFGFQSPDEIIGKVKVMDLVAPEDRQIVEKNLRSLDGVLNTVRYTFKALRKDGRIIDVEVHGTKTAYNGKPAIIGSLLDITDRKKAEEALKERQYLLRQVLDANPNIIFVVDRNSRIILANQSLAEFYKTTVKDLEGKSQIDYHLAAGMNRDEIEQWIADNREVIDSGRLKLVIEKSTQRDGSIHYYRTKKLPITLADGTKCALVISEDITERTRVQEALARSEEKYRSLVESTNNWVWETDENGVYTYSSPRSRDLLGYEPEEIVGKTYLAFMPPKEALRVAEIFGRIMSKQEPFELLENELVHKSGRRIIVETSGVPIFDSAGVFKGYRGTDRDVTERKRVEEEVKKQREREKHINEEAEKAKKRFYQVTIASVTDGKLNLTNYEEIDMLITSSAQMLLLSSSSDLTMLRHTVSEYCSNAGMSEERTDALISAVGEAAANAVKHANGGMARIGLKDNRIQVCIQDGGPGMDALTLSKATLLKGFSTKPSMGLGYSIILASVDTVYLATESKGTWVLMEKEIHETAPEASIDILLGSMPDNW